MNETFLQFAATVILPMWLVTMGLALFFFVMAVIYWDRAALVCAGNTALWGMSLIPGIGLLVGIVYKLASGDNSLIIVSGMITLVVLPLALLGGPYPPPPPETPPIPGEDSALVVLLLVLRGC